MKTLLFGIFVGLGIVQAVNWAPVLLPSMNWPSFFAGSLTTIVIGFVGWYGFMAYVINRQH